MEISEVSIWYKEPNNIIELRNKDRQIIGSINTRTVDPARLVLSTTNTDEKYYLYYDGIGIFFSYWAKNRT